MGTSCSDSFNISKLPGLPSTIAQGSFLSDPEVSVCNKLFNKSRPTINKSVGTADLRGDKEVIGSKGDCLTVTPYLPNEV